VKKRETYPKKKPYHARDQTDMTSLGATLVFQNRTQHNFCSQFKTTPNFLQQQRRQDCAGDLPNHQVSICGRSHFCEAVKHIRINRNQSLQKVNLEGAADQVAFGNFSSEDIYKDFNSAIKIDLQVCPYLESAKFSCCANDSVSSTACAVLFPSIYLPFPIPC
jgi:hypothetical protein